MPFCRSSLSVAALSLLASFASVAHAAASPASSSPAAMSDRGLEITSPLKLDATALMAMKPGQKLDIAFPVIGRKTVVFESTTKGLDGSRYWHGALAGSPRDRVFLKQQKDGFVGAIRFGGKQVAFAQQNNGQLSAVRALAPVAGQAYAVGAARSQGVYDIQGNFAAMAQAAPGSEISLPLPQGRSDVAIVTHTETDHDGFVQIQGISRMEGMGSPTVITIGKDGVFGTFYAQGHEYQIVTRNGQQQLIDPKAAGWKEVRGVDAVAAAGGQGDLAAAAARAARDPNHGGTPPTAGITATTTTATTTTSLVPLPAGQLDTTINLLMTYGPSYVAQWGSETNARIRLSNLVQVANSAYSNSGTGIRFRITGWAQLAQPDNTPQTNLPAMRGGTGPFAGLATLKRNAGASIAVFFSPFNATTGSSSTCGLAYVPGASSGGLSAFQQQVASSTYASLNDGQYNGSYCESLSLGHELGHNLGAVHDKANSSFTGTFDYSYGKGVSGVFGTIMSYIYPRTALFSSPQLTCGGAQPQPCGTSSENVVATMLQTKASVAALSSASASTVAATGYTMVAGWLFNADGSPYTGTAAVVTPTNASVYCMTGSTGLYVCKVPTGVTSVTVSVSVAGKTVAPSVGSFPVDPLSNTPVNGTRFYLN